jgi:hypothetical protein
MKTSDILPLNEAALAAKELVKDFHGQRRTDILATAIEKSTPLLTKTGDIVVLPKLKNKGIPEQLRSLSDADILKMFGGTKPAIVFTTKEGQPIKITQLEKTEMFGSSKGKGAGAAQTTMQEIAQCVVFAAAGASKLNNKIDSKDITVRTLNKGLSAVKSDKAPKESVTFLVSNPDWADTAVLTVQKVLRHVKIDLSQYEFHRQSPLVKNIQKEFSTLNKTLGADKFTSIDKWNPSDIWIVKKGFKISTGFDTLLEYNAYLKQQFKKKTLIGVSLKKVGRQATAKTFNVDNDIEDILQMNLQKLVASKSNELFSSKDSFIVYEGVDERKRMLTEGKASEIQFRSFDDQAKIQGEIKGKAASHGKIGNGGVNVILRAVGATPLRPNTYWKNMVKGSKSVGYKKVIQEIVKMIKNSKLPGKTGIAADTTKNLKQIISAKGMTADKVVSKAQAIELIAKLSNLSNEYRQAFLHKSFQYASSRSELSSIFIKVS